jgi:hypothetical protein
VRSANGEDERLSRHKIQSDNCKNAQSFMGSGEGYFNWLISDTSSVEKQVVPTPSLIAVRIAAGGI